MTTTADRDYLSIGQLAAHLQRPVRAIEQTAATLKIRPAMRLNQIPYFNGRQVEKLTAEISKGNK